MKTYDNVVPLSQPSFSGKLPSKPLNKDVRSREYLTDKEVGRLMDAARKTGRHGHRDATLILIGYRHAFRVSELVSLRWDQIDLGQGLMHINRLKFPNCGNSASTESLKEYYTAITHLISFIPIWVKKPLFEFKVETGICPYI